MNKISVHMNNKYLRKIQ